VFVSEEIAGLPIRFKGKHGNFFRLSLSHLRRLTAASKHGRFSFPYGHNINKTIIFHTAQAFYFPLIA
jgi:hypothetical protein